MISIGHDTLMFLTRPMWFAYGIQGRRPFLELPLARVGEVFPLMAILGSENSGSTSNAGDSLMLSSPLEVSAPRLWNL
jgi:hypothetical protein